MRVLYLDTNTDKHNDFFRKERMKVNYCDSFCIYKTKRRNLVFKLIQLIGIYLFSPILYFIYGDWKYKINEYDLFIVTSRKSCKYAIKFLKKKTKKRVIVWYWNVITHKEMNPIFCKKYGCETWTFDLNDANKFNMKFNDTYYFPKTECLDEIKPEYDLFYIGLNKRGREKLLIKIANYCENNNLKYKIHLVGSNNTKFSNKSLSYNEIIRCINNSRAILDLNVENQSGMTLRPLEAIFYNKLLITNNSNIVSYRAYIKENTMIIKDNKLDSMLNFLSKDIYKVDKKITDFYLFSNWLKRLINDTEENIIER